MFSRSSTSLFLAVTCASRPKTNQSGRTDIRCQIKVCFHVRCKKWKYRLTGNHEPLNSVIQSKPPACTSYLSRNQYSTALNFQRSVFDFTCRSNDSMIVLECASFASLVDFVSQQTRPKSAANIFFVVSRRRRSAPPLLTASVGHCRSSSIEELSDGPR